MFSWNSKYRKIGPHGLGALLLITMAVILRVVLISNGWPGTNSDEAIMALHALHIINRGEWPLFFYGQNYMGTIEAYLGAFFFRLFVPSLFALRLGLVVMYAGFLLALYFLARLLYSKGVALATVFLLCLGSNNTLTVQLIAIGGYLETLLFATLALVLSCWLVLSFYPSIGSRERRKRLVAYGCLGGVIGLGLWSDMLILPFVCTSLLLLLIFCRDELRTRASLFGLLGFVIGSFPLLLFNIQYPLENSLVTLWNLHSSGGTLLVGQNLGLVSRLGGTVMISIPMATGANPLCPISAEPGQWVHQLSFPCIGLQTCWGVGAILVWLLAVFTGIKDLQQQRQIFSISGSLMEKEHLVRCTGRLMLLASAGLTGLSYVTSPAPAIVPITSSRYLVGLLVSTPAIVAFLWPRFSLVRVADAIIKDDMVSRISADGDKSLAIDCRFVGTPFSVSPSVVVPCIVPMIQNCFLCFINLTLILGTINTFHQIPNIQKLYQRQDTLITGLIRLHALHIYSDYWTCNRLIFLSNERIICSVLDVDLGPGQNRYKPYAQIVKQDPHPAYVFDMENGTGISQDKAFTRRFWTQYHRFYLAGYAVYLPGSHWVPKR
jgi:hypothetical protein